MSRPPFSPKPTPETQPFWDGTKKGELRIQRCRDCEQFYFYPRPLCRHCFSRNVDWQTVSGRGRLHTFTINYRPRRGNTRVDFVGTDLMPRGEGRAEVSGQEGVIKLEVRLDNLVPPRRCQSRSAMTFSSGRLM